MKSQFVVVDTAAVLTHVPLWEYGETLYSVPEALEEIRDKQARQRLEALPVSITMRQPQPHSIRFVNEFSRKTGDYASLSLADIKLLALTYELEVEVQGGADHLNSEPQKIYTEGTATRASRREQQSPGEFNDPKEHGDVATQMDITHTVDMTEIKTSSCSPAPVFCHLHLIALDPFLQHHSYIAGYTPSGIDFTLHHVLVTQFPQLCLPLEDQSEECSKNTSQYHADSSLSPQLPPVPHVRRWAAHITSFTEEEKLLYPRSSQTPGEILCSLTQQSQCAPSEETEVEPVLPSHTEQPETAAQEEDAHSDAESAEGNNDGKGRTEHSEAENEGVEDGNNGTNVTVNEEEEEEDSDEEGWITCKNIKKHKGKRNIFGVMEEEEEEDKEVKVACITADFAMQNVLKHIGLAVMGTDGRLIKHLRTYILRCHACFKTTSVMDRIFCKHCGNKTLKKVSVTLNPDGTQRIWINTKKPISKRGMKYSLPTPKGGKHGRNPILVQDQREAKKFSSKMSRKKINPLHEDYNPDQTPFAVRDVYSRAAQLGYIGGKNHNHYYWEKRNPNEPQMRTGNK